MLCSACNKESKFRYGARFNKILCQGCYKKYVQNSSPLKKCECSPECQEMIHSITINGNIQKYKCGHQNRLRSRERHHYYNKGRRKQGEYIGILRPHHPYSDDKGYIREHRYIMELQLGRYLNRGEVVHHIDKNTRNNNENNLMLFENHSKHIKYERPPIDTSDRRCYKCNSNKTYIKDNHAYWFKREEGYSCSICRDRERYDLRRKNVWRKNIN